MAAFLHVLLTKVGSYLEGELALVLGFKKDFEKLSSTFSTIQAVLEDAEQKQLKDKAIQNWLQKLNAAAYEVDDIFDECQTESTRFKQSLLGRYDPGIITFRFKMAKRMKEVMEKVDAIAEERSKFHYLRENIVERKIIRHESGYILTEPEIYGRDRELNEIVKILLNNAIYAEEISVLPIIGIGGLGKTTLAQMVFNDERVIEHFDLKIWVCVSDDFDEKRLIKAIIESIEEKLLGNMDLALLQKKLKGLLNGKRYLLVLDDVWNEDQEKWAKLRGVLKGGASGASVVTTTRLEKVGSIMGTVQPYQLSNLSQEDCWSLFMQRAFGHKMEANPNLVAIGTKIVKKCGGVPLAAKTLGSLLRFKREESEWKYVRDSEIWNLSQDETSILAALRLSYQNLPLDLRQCFLYCAKFRKDTRMEKENLITLWMAHGFLSSKGNLEAEDVGNEVWEELHLRSFFQEIEKDKFGKTYFKIHDLIHDLASSEISATTPSNQVRQVAVRGINMFIDFAEAGPSYSLSLLKKFRSLRVLDLSFSSMDKLSSSIGDLIHLRFLDMSHTNIRTLPERLCNLQNLQTLNLSYCYSLSCLPTQMSKLSSLRILRLKLCHKLTSMPPRIGSLTCLKTLRYFIVGERKGYQLGELGNLNQLRGSLSIEHLERVKIVNDAKEANLSRKDLSNLCLSWDRDDDKFESEDMDEKVLEALKPHPSLEFLRIRGFRGFRFPNWMNGSLLQKMVSVEINGCKRCSRLPLFGNMPCLETLKLFDGSADLEYVEEDFSSEFFTRRFPSLRSLTIGHFPNLKGLMKKEGKEQFPKLEAMYVLLCPMLIFPALPSVKRLDVHRDTDATSLSSISNLRNLTYLHISSNEATSLPEEMFQGLVNLETLYIVLCKNLKELPSSLASLNALKFFTIECCTALECLPEQGLEGLTSLSQLRVQLCRSLKSLSEGLQHLTALTTLVVDGCPELVGLPEGIRNLYSLKLLEIRCCAGLQPVQASIMELKNNMQDLQISFVKIPQPEERTVLYKEEFTSFWSCCLPTLRGRLVAGIRIIIPG